MGFIKDRIRLWKFSKEEKRRLKEFQKVHGIRKKKFIHVVYKYIMYVNFWALVVFGITFIQMSWSLTDVTVKYGLLIAGILNISGGLIGFWYVRIKCMRCNNDGINNS